MHKIPKRILTQSRTTSLRKTFCLPGPDCSSFGAQSSESGICATVAVSFATVYGVTEIPGNAEMLRL